MKAVLGLMGLAAVLSVSQAAGAADLSGTWKGTFDLNGNSVPLALNLKAEGTAVTGTVETPVASTAEIHDGKVDGDNFSFWVNSDYQGSTYKIVYKGKVSGDHIALSLGIEDGSWGTDMVVKKEGVAGGAVAEPPKAPEPPKVPESPKAVDVTGVWKGAFDLNGTSMPIALNLKGAGAAVSGTAEGLGPAPIEIHDGKVDGNLVTFSVNTEYQGQAYVLTFKGPVTANQIDFAFGTAGGEWGSTVTVKK